MTALWGGLAGSRRGPRPDPSWAAHLGLLPGPWAMLSPPTWPAHFSWTLDLLRAQLCSQRACIQPHGTELPLSGMPPSPVPPPDLHLPPYKSYRILPSPWGLPKPTPFREASWEPSRYFTPTPTCLPSASLWAPLWAATTSFQMWHVSTKQGLGPPHKVLQANIPTCSNSFFSRGQIARHALQSMESFATSGPPAPCLDPGVSSRAHPSMPSILVGRPVCMSLRIDMRG